MVQHVSPRLDGSQATAPKGHAEPSAPWPTPSTIAAFECGYIAAERGHNIQEARRRFICGEAF